MESTIVGLMHELVDLKVERAVAQVMAEMQKLANAHNALRAEHDALVAAVDDGSPGVADVVGRRAS